MSQAVVNAVSSLANTWVSKSINTGDRMMDTGLITLCTVFLGLVLSYITNLYTSKWNRNYLRSWWYWQTDPYEFQQDWYEYDTHDNIHKMDDEYVYNMILEHNKDRHIYVPYLEKLVHTHTPIGKSANIGYVNLSNTKQKDTPIKMVGHYNYVVQDSAYYPIYIRNGYPVYMARVDCNILGCVCRKFVSEDKTNLTTVVYDFMKYLNEEKEKEDSKQNPDIKYINTFQVPDGLEVDPLRHDIGTFIDNHTKLVNKRRTFDTLFFEDKERLVGVLEKFQSGTMYSKHLSLDNKLGILLYGPPGTGKTGTISAIANYTNRGILQINLMDVILNGLVDILLNPIYFKKYVYVFDEFDHMMIEHFKTTETCKSNHSSNISNNDNENDKEKRIDWASVLTVSKDEERNKILEMMKESIKKQKKRKKTDFGYFLSKLDGLEDASGRVMVFCTNNPQILKKSYPALFRPGRIDMKLCLGNCTQSMYENIIIAALELEDTQDIRDIIREAKLPHDTWSPLDVINTALVNQSLSKTLDALTRSHHRSI